MSETVAIIDYGSGNLRSAEKALARAGVEAGLDSRIIVTDKPDVVASADRVVLPGVGAFGDCRRGLLAIDGLKEAIREAVRVKGQPFLGICVGMHLMAREGHEHGTHQGMGWIDGVVEKMEPADGSLKIPHMGWNEIELTDAGRAHPVAGVIEPGDHAYFVHSYHMALADKSALLATTDYGMAVTAIVGEGNIIGTQFHPEKSQKVGLKLLRAFLEWRP
ncbi:imidazole glycerol phosphate synthase subunit HisH [Kordiimonas marina]|uniref:imidazole glycerol phosphate synthase subunit HisH n=1 Tax=Kordiimonas marina TaxID=2872312 RepID=UPI001FF56522|nr:imidazole glycerol phosphate synthase subunit HisH [Kordiimonas marina]MCJ9428177.1 imidazole glycerol phosphate synthase subunit HisH [Kordiimonas marina]